MAFNLFIPGDEGGYTPVESIPSGYSGPVFNALFNGEDFYDFTPIDPAVASDPSLQYGKKGSAEYQLDKYGQMGESYLSSPSAVAQFLKIPGLPADYDWSDAIKKAYNQQVGQFGSGFNTAGDDPAQTALKIIQASDLKNKDQISQYIRDTPQFAQSQALGAANLEASRRAAHDPGFLGTGIPVEVGTAVLSAFGGPLGMMGMSTGNLILNSVLNQIITQGITTGDINLESLAKTAISSVVAPEITGALQQAGISPEISNFLVKTGAGALSGGQTGALGAALRIATEGLGKTTGSGEENSFDTGLMNQVLGIPATQGSEENSFDTGAMNQVLGIPDTQTGGEGSSDTGSINSGLPSDSTDTSSQVMGPLQETFKIESPQTATLDQPIINVGDTQVSETGDGITRGALDSVGTQLPDQKVEQTDTNSASTSVDNRITQSALDSLEPQLPAGTNVTIDDTGSVFVTDDQGNVITSTDSGSDRYTTVDVGDGSKLVIDTTTGDVVDSINKSSDYTDSTSSQTTSTDEETGTKDTTGTEYDTEEEDDTEKKDDTRQISGGLDLLGKMLGIATGGAGGSRTGTRSLSSKTSSQTGLGDQTDSSGVPWLSSTPEFLKSESGSYKPLELAKLPQMTQFGTTTGGDEVGSTYMPTYGEGGSASDKMESVLRVVSGGLSPLEDVLKRFQPKFVEEDVEPKKPVPIKRKPVTLSPLNQMRSRISPLGNMEGLSSGGLPRKYENASPKGHNPEFITGLTGFYADGRGTGQSDDIPALLHDGDYVMDAETVSALGDGSSKAGREVLDGFRNKIPHSKAAGGRVVPAKIADGEYVFPESFVTSLGSGDNKRGAKILDGLREKLRAHKRAAPLGKIPPKAKSPLEYIEKVKG